MHDPQETPLIETAEETRVPTARWYHDRDGQFWNFSKADGGLRVENEDGTFGRPIPSWVAKDDFAVVPCDPDVCVILDEFERLKGALRHSADPDAMDDFRKLRGSVMRIVRVAKHQQQALAAIETKKEEA